MKKSPKIMSVILAALLLSACTPATADPTIDSSETPTVQNIFDDTTAPSTTIAFTDPSTSTAPSNDTTEPSPGSVFVGSLAIGPAGEPLRDENGPYRIYEGGEMLLPFEITTTGSIADNGVGILLFIDGKPQPYKTDEEPEYAYLHTFYPGEDNGYIFNFYFTPVTGSQGDLLEIYASSVLYPTYSRADGEAGMVYTSGSTASGFRLKYQETPLSGTYPEKLPWLSDSSVSFMDTTISDTAGWSDYQFREQIAYRFLVNGISDTGRTSRIAYGISASEPLSLRYEVWGSPYVHFGLVFFVDNVPVADIDAEPFMLEVHNGQKTVVEATLNLEQFDGESVIYAILVPRNYRSSEVRTTAFLECTNAIFLVEEASSQ